MSLYLWASILCKLFQCGTVLFNTIHLFLPLCFHTYVMFSHNIMLIPCSMWNVTAPRIHRSRLVVAVGRLKDSRIAIAKIHAATLGERHCKWLKGYDMITWMFLKIGGKPPKSSILIGFFIINHPFWSTPIFGNTQLDLYMISYDFCMSHICGSSVFEFCGQSTLTWWARF